MTPEEQAAVDAAQDKFIRDLAAQIAAMTKLPFDPATIRKAEVTAVSDSSTPPTVSLNISGDTTTLVSQVRTLNNFTPVVGQTVLLTKQGTEIFILGAIAATNPYSVNTGTDNGWIRLTQLAAGSHGGNSNGDIYYRRILDHGSWKMQWRGGWTVSGSTLVAAGGLDTDYRPSSKRSVLAARHIQTGAVSVQFDFNTDGSVTLIGANTVPSLSTESTDTSSASPGTNFIDPIDSTTAGGADGHTHGVVGDHAHTVNSHWHNLNGHNHTVTVSTPTWVSLNGVEYFL